MSGLQYDVIFVRMKTLLYFSPFLAFLLACSSSGIKDAGHAPEKNVSKITRTQVAEAVKDYFMKNLVNPVAGENNELFRIQGDKEICMVKFTEIFTGKLNNDEKEDAIVSYSYEKTGSKPVKKHLILINDGGLHIVKDFTAPMVVLALSDRRVIAEVDNSSPDIPWQQGCHTCKETVIFRLQGDSLVRSE
jgi:hypothetical protein